MNEKMVTIERKNIMLKSKNVEQSKKKCSVAAIPLHTKEKRRRKNLQFYIFFSP